METYDHDVMQCAICGGFHFTGFGSCPYCGEPMYFQNCVDDTYYAQALRDKAQSLRDRADRLDRMAEEEESK